MRSLLCRRSRAVASGAALLALVGSAQATVYLAYGCRVPTFYELAPGGPGELGGASTIVAPEVPANGVLVCDEEVTSVEVRRGDNVVPGSLTLHNDQLIWRPAQELPVGTYTAAAGVSADTFGYGGTTEFTVAPAVNVPADFVTLELTLKVEPAEESARACCGEDPELASPLPPCDPNVVGSCAPDAPEPYCPVVSYREGLRVTGTVQFDHAHPAATQVLVRFTETPDEAQIVDDAFRVSASVSSYDFDPTEDEYCFSIEVWNLIDDSVETIRQCTENPKPILDDVAAPRIYFPELRTCLLPPEGYTELWCASTGVYCEEIVAQAYGENYDYQVALCVHYYELCDAEPPPEAPIPVGVGGSPYGSGGSYGTGGSTFEPGTGNTRPRYQLANESPSLTDGCACRWGMGRSPVSGARGLLAGGAVLLLAWRRRRRIQRH